MHEDQNGSRCKMTTAAGDALYELLEDLKFTDYKLAACINRLHRYLNENDLTIIKRSDQIILLAIFGCVLAEEKRQEKRGLLGLGYGGGYGGLGHGGIGIAEPIHVSAPISIGYGGGIGHGIGGLGLGLGHGLGHGIGLGYGGVGLAAPIIKTVAPAPIYTKAIAAPLITKSIVSAPIAYDVGYGGGHLGGGGIGYGGIGYGKYLH